MTTVFQRPILLNRSVQANVGYGLRLRGRRNSSDEIERALEQVGLLHLARQRARTLSGGEAQRVALARAIVLQPDVLLLDEPTANLDPYNVGLIEEIVTNLNRRTRYDAGAGDPQRLSGQAAGPPRGPDAGRPDRRSGRSRGPFSNHRRTRARQHLCAARWCIEARNPHNRKKQGGNDVKESMDPVECFRAVGEHPGWLRQYP